MDKRFNISGPSNGVGFLDILGIVFIVLKLVGVINWSWIWVLAPIWVEIIVVVVFLVVMNIAAKHERL